MKTTLKFLFFGAFIIVFPQITSAQELTSVPFDAHMPIPVRPGVEELYKEIQANWHSSRRTSCTNTISVTIDDTGKIHDPIVEMYSGDDQFDAECVEAICSSSPIQRTAKNKDIKGLLIQFGEHGSRKFHKGLTAPDIDAFLNTNTKDERFVLVHKIPLSVLSRYPGYFKESELINQNNLLQIEVGPEPPKDRWTNRKYIISIAKLYLGWDQLFRKKPVSKQAIIDQAAKAKALLSTIH